MDLEPTPVLICLILFVALPWIILHYMTQWKRNKGLTAEDENLLDDLHDTARRLDGRLESIERIMTADHPGWKERATSISDQSGRTLPRH
ncbi:MAG: envelope stress response membrane protein PspB [Polymorphobacter sp.]